MSASTRTTTTVHKPRQFPGNCTLEMALKTVVDVFHRYSSRKSSIDLLDSKNFRKLMTEQAPTFLEDCGRGRPEYLEELFKETDLDNDREVSFEEFTIVLAKLTSDTYYILHEEDRCQPDNECRLGHQRREDPRGASSCHTPQTQEHLSELEKAIDVIIDVFHQYSRREGDRDTLTKSELKLLIEKQLANYLKHVKNQATIDEIMKDLDLNKDQQLSFNETMLLIIRVTVATHDHLHEVEDHQHQHQHPHQHQHQQHQHQHHH
ncbi:PREDICTED: putative cyclin-dependent serine/threonine-protein kinase DDB_G0272797/DDB_G0274007 [Buceros rhinoceros silvestris]|nr:PREDICTED: putative cyclin-dependent serine/threonine-protein kinase DDB_G0272797/DDB_G0274007 [Buceros rhinoceros silvestris]